MIIVKMAVVTFLVALFAYARVSDEPTVGSYAVFFFGIGVTTNLFMEEILELGGNGLLVAVPLFTVMISGYVIGSYYLYIYTKSRQLYSDNQKDTKRTHSKKLLRLIGIVGLLFFLILTILIFI